MNIKRWLLCAFLMIICFFFLRWLNSTSTIVEGHGGGGGGHGGGGHGGGRGGYYGGRGGYYGGGRGYYRGGHGGSGYYYGGVTPLYTTPLYTTPLYIYEDDQPYWYRYIPFFGY